MNSTENHNGAALTRLSADLISAQCVPRVYPYPDDISLWDDDWIQRIECFIHDCGVVIKGCRRGTRKYIQPTGSWDRGAEGDMFWGIAASSASLENRAIARMMATHHVGRR